MNAIKSIFNTIRNLIFGVVKKVEYMKIEFSENII